MIRFFLLGIIPFFIISCHTSSEKVATSEIRITEDIVNENFGGIGFHVFYHLHTPPKWHYEQIFAKRWRELNPSFARITDNPKWDKAKMDTVVQSLEVMKGTDTKLYFTTWGSRQIYDYDQEIDYVRKEVDNLEYIKNEKGFKNLNYFCFTNELSLDEWASLVKDDKLDYFKFIHQLFYDEFGKRDLDIKLLATDASPIQYWHTIEWAAENMDDITGVYGGHHYINGYDLFDNSFYPFFLEKMKWGSSIAKSKGKEFIIGEFGPKQNQNVIDGIKHDACIYNNLPYENYTGIQISEAILAMINGGIHASSYWTFADFPSKYRSNYINKWGVFKWEIDDFGTRPSYYALGLLTKFFRGPAKAFEANSPDSLLRVSAIQNLEDNSVSIAILNRNSESRKLDFQVDAFETNQDFRKYVYDPEDVPFNHFGDLQSHSKKVSLKNGRFSDDIPPMSLVVLTTKYDEVPPSSVKNFKVEKQQRDRERNVLSWDQNNEDDFCYYRIYRSEKENVEIIPMRQIGTTISTEYVDLRDHGLPQYYYKVVAVDNSGNASE